MDIRNSTFPYLSKKHERKASCSRMQLTHMKGHSGSKSSEGRTPPLHGYVNEVQQIINGQAAEGLLISIMANRS
ncbi:hypothetical protein WA026_008994, partial [Henosepilachna vigintioctopunctata]